jgi:ribulose-5-phosphate 3-epimerase (EC 5.1.3.1)
LVVLSVYVDGSSQGNPGPAGIGVIACDEGGQVIATRQRPLPSATNNEAEYQAILEGLRLARELGASEVIIFSDSELVVRQLQGAYQVRSEGLKGLWREAKELMRQFRRCEIRHIPREQNAQANRLAQQASGLASFRPRAVKIAPSILSADFRRLGEVMRELTESGADWVHFDVMDGHFVPNISFGLPVIEALRPETSLPFDVHLMIAEPERYVDAFVKAGADIVAVHVEATAHLHRLVARIKELGAKAGVALNPATPAEWIRPILPFLDVVLVMTVDPGFAGQKFLPFVLDKVRTVRRWIDERGLIVELEVDGGVTAANAADCVAAGATVLVSASGIFQSGLPIPDAIEALRQAVKKVTGDGTEKEDEPPSEGCRCGSLREAEKG